MKPTLKIQPSTCSSVIEVGALQEDPLSEKRPPQVIFSENALERVFVVRPQKTNEDIESNYESEAGGVSTTTIVAMSRSSWKTRFGIIAALIVLFLLIFIVASNVQPHS